MLNIRGVGGVRPPPRDTPPPLTLTDIHTDLPIVIGFAELVSVDYRNDIRFP